MPSFYEPALRYDDTIVNIEGEEYHHIVNVFRHKEGDKISILNGKGLQADAQIISLKKRTLTAAIIERKIIEKKSPDIAVFFSLLKNKHDHLIVEKLTELGVKEFFPFISKRTIRSATDKTIEKLSKVSIAAMKQCDNAWLPNIHSVKMLDRQVSDFKSLKKNDCLLLAAVERGSTQLIDQSIPSALPANIAVIIGSEGGFSDEELQFFEASEASLITLGKHILRAETAAICAVSQILLILNSRVANYY